MNLFDQNNDEPSIDQSKNYLEELVGDGKKFKSPEELARGKAEADLTIEVMKRRMDELRADYTKVSEEARAQAKLQDLIDRLEKSPLKNENLDTDENDTVKQPVFDPDKFKLLAADTFKELEAQKKAETNYNTVQAKLKERFGSNYAQVLKERTEELGLSPEDVNALATKSPTAFFNTLGLNETRQIDNFSPPANSRRSDNFGPARTQKRTWSYYQDLKKTNPKLYFDSKIANQMIADMAALGEEFKDGDYNAI